MARVHSQPRPDTTGICSLSSRVHGSKVPAKFGVSQCSKIPRCILSLRCTCPCFASCDCRHDSFIVRSAQTRPPFTGFTQLAHPSRCSRSTLTTVCFCARASLRVSVFTSGLQPRHQTTIGSSPSTCSGVWDPCSVEYQSCKPAMLL